MANWQRIGIEDETRLFAERVINLIRVEELYEALQEFRSQAWSDGYVEGMTNAIKTNRKSQILETNSAGQKFELVCRLADGDYTGGGEDPELPGYDYRGGRDGGPRG